MCMFNFLLDTCFMYVRVRQSTNWYKVMWKAVNKFNGIKFNLHLFLFKLLEYKSRKPLFFANSHIWYQFFFHMQVRTYISHVNLIHYYFIERSTLFKQIQIVNYNQYSILWTWCMYSTSFKDFLIWTYKGYCQYRNTTLY